MNITSQNPTAIPNYHFEQLKQIEDGYWWYEGRLLWAKAFIYEWIKKQNLSVPLIYADLGCGTGGFGLEIQKTFSIDHAYLIDSNADAIDKIGPTGNAKVLTVNLEKDIQLPFVPNLVSCMDVIEHLKEDSLFLKRVAGTMEKNGLLVLSVPAHPFLFSAWDTQLGHFRRYQKKTVRNIVVEAGFKIQRCHYVWSFLFPAAFYRFLSKSKQEKLEYPATPEWLNNLMIQAARTECSLSNWIKFPFGTSVMISAVKE